MTQVAQELSFGAAAQRLELAVLLPRLQGFQEQPRLRNHPLAHRARCTLVMRKPLRQLTGGQRLLARGPQQRGGVRRVGARQRRQHPGGRPAREASRAHRSQALRRQPRQQRQPPVHPTDIPTTAARQLMLGEAKALQELAQQQRLFDRIEPPGLRARQGLQQPLRQLAPPHLNLCGIPPQTLQRRHASIAINQHPALPQCTGLLLKGRHRHAGNELSALLDGLRQTLHRARFRQSRLSKPQLQAVQIDFQCGVSCRDHGRHVSPRGRGWLSRPLLQATYRFLTVG